MKTLTTILISCLLFSCSAIRELSPAQRCAILKNGARIGVGVALSKLPKEEIEKHRAAVSPLIQKELLPRLQGHDTKPLTGEEINDLLSNLEKKLTGEEAAIIAAAIDSAVIMLPVDAPKTVGLGSEIIKSLICIFQGALEAIAGPAIEKKALMIETKKGAVKAP